MKRAVVAVLLVVAGCSTFGLGNAPSPRNTIDRWDNFKVDYKATMIGYREWARSLAAHPQTVTPLEVSIHRRVQKLELQIRPFIKAGDTAANIGDITAILAALNNSLPLLDQLENELARRALP